ncbi:MAG TPA: DUF559 domain-containing protein [Arachnia sp.]|nr:DUF559 domain-containing protein [Arachnia sp.]HMT87647.1 DUF559 domain-containing protein [Arachnia sp.]
MTALLHAVLRTDGILSRRQHPELIGQIDAAVKRGEIVPLLPGTYAAAATFHSLVLSVADWDPNAVFTGSTAARLAWWPELDDDTVRAATRRRPRRELRGVDLRKILMWDDLVETRRGLRFQSPSASALDLARERGADAIDEALRRRVTTVEHLRESLRLMPRRPGNAELLRLIRASRDGAWSELERDAHQRLHRSRIVGWKANYRIRTAGQTYYADVAFPGARVIAEFDGWRYHSDQVSFVWDRRRDVALKLSGWTVLRFTAQSIDEFIPALRQALSRAA